MALFFMPVIDAAKYVFILLLITFLFFNLRWWNFMRKEAGLFFSLKALLLNYVLGIDIIIASVYGLISYFSKKDSGVQEA